ESSAHTPASAPGLFGSRRFNSVRIAIGGTDYQNLQLRAGVRGGKIRGPERAWTRKAPRVLVATSTLGVPRLYLVGKGLREHLDDHAAVLGATVLGLVFGDRLVLTVRDDVHPMERNLVLLVQIPLH